MSTCCQLQDNRKIGQEPWVRYLSRQAKRLGDGFRAGVRYGTGRARGAVRRLGRGLGWTALAAPGPGYSGVKAGVEEDLKPGTRVRVRARAQIEATLDLRRQCHGCPFAEPMFRLCGQEFRVAKQVRQFFDEARGRLVKCRNIVLLEGVYCDGSGYPESRGCDRTCFFFWHTKWLERVE